MRLNDRCVVITGGGHGIGRAYAERCAGEGAAVAVADIDGDAAEVVAAAIVEAGGRAVGLKADVRDLESMQAVVARAEEAFGGVDGLINNAGMLTIIPISRVGFESIDEAEWDDVLDTNLKGTWLACKHALPLLREYGFRAIVFVIPPMVDTGAPLLWPEVADDQREHPGVMRSMPIANRSIKRIEVPEDLTGAAVFFLSSDSDYITGQTLVVEGGGILH